MNETPLKIQFREGELENLLLVRNKYILLLEKYIKDFENISKSKLLGTMFDTIFYIGICNLRKHSPSIKEIYLSVGEVRNTSLRQLDILEESNIIMRIPDKEDSRIKRIELTDKFREDFEFFVETWVDPRKQNKTPE